ncbi:MAG: hypothetical protein RIS19_760, partial [Actinomycetota bacterium]
MTELVTRVNTALDGVIDPELRKPITQLDMVGEIQGDLESFSVE